ncbi:MAG TPA: PAS domain S-box protein [Methanophagales archaeon]|nr:PAS domain S-box protein [Methanophagales archaeon]
MALQRHKREKSLRESEEKFRTFLETASNLMNNADRDGNITYVNESMAKTLGYSKEELIGMHITQLLTKEALEIVFKPNWEEFKREGEIDLETTFATKEGREIYGELKAVAVYDSDGKYAGSRAVFHDLTDKNKAEEELRKSKEIRRALYEKSRDGYVIVKGNGEFMDARPRFCDIAGYSMEER